MEESGEITLTSWYVNQHRIIELLGYAVLLGIGQNPMLLASALGPRVLTWIQANKIPSLSRLVTANKLKKGSIFVHEARFFSRNFRSDDHVKPADVMLRYPLKELDPTRSDFLEVRFHTDGLTTASAFGALKGQPCVYVCAVVSDVTGNEIVAHPLVIGHLVQNFGTISLRFGDFVEVRASQFDAFKDIDFQSHVSIKTLDVLKDVSEDKVKHAFARAIGEPFVDKDWGGEYGDLFSVNPRIEGDPVACGFMFKGPSKFKELHPADCGKNGDQPIRLFNLPAKCFVLQHCHKVSPAVRRIMRALTLERFSESLRYCIIDGYQTYAILKHLGELP